MPGTFHARIPFESLDPLTIGASDDESKVYRAELELEIPEPNLLAAIYPEEPEPVPSATDAAREALAFPTSGPSFAASRTPCSTEGMNCRGMTPPTMPSSNCTPDPRGSGSSSM